MRNKKVILPADVDHFGRVELRSLLEIRPDATEAQLFQAKCSNCADTFI